MIAVIFEVWPSDGRKDDYLEIAASLRADLNNINGFISVERFHVNGRQDSAYRSDIMRTFAEEPKALVTNARCLTEGVNIPAVDMVAFIDPKRGRIDIAQAVGRAMRKPRGPTKKSSDMFWCLYSQASEKRQHRRSGSEREVRCCSGRGERASRA